MSDHSMLLLLGKVLSTISWKKCCYWPDCDSDFLKVLWVLQTFQLHGNLHPYCLNHCMFVLVVNLMKRLCNSMILSESFLCFWCFKPSSFIVIFILLSNNYMFSSLYVHSDKRILLCHDITFKILSCTEKFCCFQWDSNSTHLKVVFLGALSLPTQFQPYPPILVCVQRMNLICGWFAFTVQIELLLSVLELGFLICLCSQYYIILTRFRFNMRTTFFSILCCNWEWNSWINWMWID